MFIFGKTRGGAATADEAAEAVRLVEASVAARAATENVARGDLEEGPAWEAGVQVLRDLGDEVGADRCDPAVQTRGADLQFRDGFSLACYQFQGCVDSNHFTVSTAYVLT